jgi:hypothetical protein
MRFRPNRNHATRLVAAAIIAASTVVAFAAPAAAEVSRPAITPSTSVHSTTTKPVPLVVGWNAASAITALRAHGFVYTLKPPTGQVLKTPSHWTVTSQSPKGKSNAKAGSRVTLNVILTTVYIAQRIRSFYSKDYGTFTASAHTGAGSTTFAFPKGIQSLLVVATHSGSGSFSITELGAGNLSTKRVPVSVKGSYSGMVALGLSSAKVRTTAIRISGSGTWHVTLEPIAAAPIIAIPASGTGDHVYLYSGKAAIWKVSSPGPTIFALNQFSSGSYPNLAVDESGNWSGPVALEPGPSVVEIHSNGAWSIH